MTRALFEDIVIKESHEPLVNIMEYPFLTEPSYFNQGFSQQATMWLRKSVANKLLDIQASFNGKYRFKIWDGYRPREVQDAIYNSFWKKLAHEHPDWTDEQLHHAVEKFVTKATTQKRIPPHATGGAVDLTLVDEGGNELDMGTVFDYFGDAARPLYYEENTIDENIRNNRRILRTAMLENGFTPDDDEWWHYDFGNQLWALRSKHESAIFGEATPPVRFG